MVLGKNIIIVIKSAKTLSYRPNYQRKGLFKFELNQFMSKDMQ